MKWILSNVGAAIYLTILATLIISLLCLITEEIKEQRRGR